MDAKYLLFFLIIILIILIIIKSRGWGIPLMILIFFTSLIFIISFLTIFEVNNTPQNFNTESTITPNVTDVIDAKNDVESGCKENPEAGWVYLGSGSKNMLIGEETNVHLDVTNNELKEDLVITYRINIPPGFSTSSLHSESNVQPITIKPGDTFTKIINIKAIESVNEPIRAYVSYYKDNKSLGVANISRCVNVK